MTQCLNPMCLHRYESNDPICPRCGYDCPVSTPGEIQSDMVAAYHTEIRRMQNAIAGDVELRTLAEMSGKLPLQLTEEQIAESKHWEKRMQLIRLRRFLAGLDRE